MIDGIKSEISDFLSHMVTEMKSLPFEIMGSIKGFLNDNIVFTFSQWPKVAWVFDSIKKSDLRVGLLETLLIMLSTMYADNKI